MRKQKNTTTGLVVVLVMMVIIVVAIFAGSRPVEMGVAGSVAGADVNIKATAYNDGVAVDVPLAQTGSFVAGGVALDSVVVEFAWTATGQSLDWDTFEMEVHIKVQAQDTIYTLTPPWPIDFEGTYVYNTASDSHIQILVLGEDIAKQSTRNYDPMNPDRTFWTLWFELTASASVDDLMGNPFEQQMTAEGSLHVGWDADFNLEGGWSY
jgi:hypothetical protein